MNGSLAVGDYGHAKLVGTTALTGSRVVNGVVLASHSGTQALCPEDLQCKICVVLKYCTCSAHGMYHDAFSAVILKLA